MLKIRAVKKILIIDDEEKLGSLMSRIIKFEGFEVFEAGNCKSALRILQQENIDIVLSDVKLPDGNGIDLTNTIKKEYPSI